MEFAVFRIARAVPQYVTTIAIPFKPLRPLIDIPGPPLLRVLWFHRMPQLFQLLFERLLHVDLLYKVPCWLHHIVSLHLLHLRAGRHHVVPMHLLHLLLPFLMACHMLIEPPLCISIPAASCPARNRKVKANCC